MLVPLIELNSHQFIPEVGFGLWKLTDPRKFQAVFDEAINCGYRHFDTAQAYNNEQLLGTAWNQSSFRREELFLTTKIDVRNFTKRRLHKSFERSLNNLKTDYVDLLLLHFPVTGLRAGAWHELEELYLSRKAKSIGVSNFTIKHLQQLEKSARIVPAVNQIELHVFLQQPELLAYCRERRIVVEAYSPLAHGKANDDPEVQRIATKHHKTYAQIMLRWCIEMGLVVLPKTATVSRVKQNVSLYDFKLDLEDLEVLAKSDRNLRTCWNPVHIP